MKISDRFQLNKSQYELDFVDIDTDRDTRLFLDPYFISKCDFPFASEAYDRMRSFFEYLLALLRARKYDPAREIFSQLGETNEVCLGLSRGFPRGHGMGPGDTDTIFEQLLESRAIETGVMEDIEDFRIFVPNVGKDKVSDMTANIIRHSLLVYTQQQCNLLGIPMIEAPTRFYWDVNTASWQNNYTDRLIIDGKLILLVPKRIVSFSDKYTAEEYKQQYVLTYLQHEQERLLDTQIARGRRRPKKTSKKSIEQNMGGISKEYLVRFTQLHPELFADFKGQAAGAMRPVSGAGEYEINITTICAHLNEKLRQIPGGTANASEYHSLMIGTLELLFYPNLSSPKKEEGIHEGRKRIDIVFNNSADSGFFKIVPNSAKLPCPFVFVECKNYTRDVANPELDQIAGRFSYQRGQIGIIACRAIDNMELFLRRCSDTYHDGRGLIIPLVDSDILTALDRIPAAGIGAIEDLLRERYRAIALR